MWVWQKLPRLHCVGISDTFRKFWSACCCLMTGLERMWNHWWWQTSAFTIHPFCETPSLSTWAPHLYWPCLLLHREEYYRLCRSAIERKEKAQSFLSKYPEEWCDDPSYQGLQMAASTMTVVNDSAERETLLWCSSTVCHWQRMKNKSTFFVSWITTGRLIGPAHWSCSKATLMKVTEDSA